jgi:hypothetical protein
VIEITAHKAYFVDEESCVVLSNETFQISKIREDRERGKRYFVVILPDRNPQISFQTPCTLRALLSYLQDAGVFFREKETAKYLAEQLISNPLQVEEITVDVKVAVYEQFVHWVWINEDRFQDQDNLAKIQYADDRSQAEIAISAITMRDFFHAAGVREKEQTQVLRYWREQGWLVTQPSQHSLTVATRFRTSRGDKIVRAFRVIVPITHGWGVEPDDAEIA